MAHTHIKIYGEKVPLNTGESKYPELEPWMEGKSVFEALETLFEKEKRRNDMAGANTATRVLQIPKGFVSDRFDDEPYIVPFIAEGSRESVLICPGGAYYDVSMDNEGYPTAEFLMEHGITAFVLKYRVWPYKYPAAMLDCRRAICYIKHHAKDFGIDPEKLSLMGFSAGGNLVAATAFLFRDIPHIDGYTPDEVDEEDMSVATLAPIYPELLADRFLMSMQFGQRLNEDAEYREKILKKMYLPGYVDKNSPPIFLSGCADDGVVPPENMLEMALAYAKAGASFEIHVFREGGHGYGVRQEDVPPMYGHPAFDMTGTREWIKIYITWLRKTLRHGNGGE
ncbi:MAG: alpha/beta hydrolase [Eubacteriales bacterium]